MNELPSKWTIALLKEVANDCQPGFACGNKDEKDGLKHLRMNNISVDGTLNLDIIRRVPKMLAKEQHYLRKSDILVCTTNSAKLVGKCALFDLEGEYAFSNHLTRLRADTRIVNNRWLQISLWYLWRLGTFENKCNNWVNQSTLPKEAFLATEVVLPPLNEQLRIVDKLEKLLARVNNCKERLDKIPSLLKRFRQSVLAAACSGRLTADWREKNPDVEPMSELLKRIKKERVMEKSTKKKISKKLKHQEEKTFVITDLPNLPLGWVCCRLGEVVQINPRHSSDILPENAEVSFAPMISIDENTWTFKNIQTRLFGEVRKGYTHFAEGDVLFAKITPCMENGKAAIARNLINGIGCGTTELHVLRPNEYILAEFIYHYIHQESFRERAKLQMTGTAGQLRVPVNFINLSPIPIPPLSEQQEIVRRVDALFKIAGQIEARYQKARAYVDKLTQSILAKAFRGELAPQAPADEPASILLERIRKERARRELESLQKGNSSRRKSPARQRKEG